MNRVCDATVFLPKENPAGKGGPSDLPGGFSRRRWRVIFMV